MAYDSVYSKMSSVAVLMLDDDTLVSVPDISFVFSVWKVFKSATPRLVFCLVVILSFENFFFFLLSILVTTKQFPDQIVGFVPRKHVSTPAGVYSYGSFELQDPELAGGDR